MQYKTKIYLSEVTNLSDARYAAGMFVDYIGFPLDSSQENHLDIHTFNAIRGWLEGVQIVGEFEDTSVNEINEIIENNELTIVSIPASRINDAEQIKAQIIIKGVKSPIQNYPTNVLFCTSDLNNPLKNCNWFVENCSISTVDSIITTAEGIVLKGSEEERPGYKEYDEIADILEALEVV